MAHTATQPSSIFFGVVHGVVHVLSKSVSAVARFFEYVHNANTTACELQNINTLSDADLSRIYGMKRDEVVQHLLKAM